MKKKILGLVATVCVLACTYKVPTFAKDNIVPNYELKFLVNSKEVLNSDYELKKTYRQEWNTGKDYNTIGVEYVETPELDFSNSGWTNRIRIKEGGKNFELTYKKRYAIENGDIEAALDKANQEGFDISDTNYAAQIDWGYDKMTLSLSNNKTASNKDYKEMELPGKKNAIKMLKDNMPGKEDNWNYKNWGSDMIDNGKKCGPIFYKKYKGNISGISVDIEIWPVYTVATKTTEYITEVSFKEDTYEGAKMNRKLVMEQLENDHILMHQDSLKTQKILNAYLN